jgi:hypothetical protein
VYAEAGTNKARRLPLWKESPGGPLPEHRPGMDGQGDPPEQGRPDGPEVVAEVGQGPDHYEQADDDGVDEGVALEPSLGL